MPNPATVPAAATPPTMATVPAPMPADVAPAALAAPAPHAPAPAAAPADVIVLTWITCVAGCMATDPAANSPVTSIRLPTLELSHGEAMHVVLTPYIGWAGGFL